MLETFKCEAQSLDLQSPDSVVVEESVTPLEDPQLAWLTLQ